LTIEIEPTDDLRNRVYSFDVLRKVGNAPAGRETIKLTLQQTSDGCEMATYEPIFGAPDVMKVGEEVTFRISRVLKDKMSVECGLGSIKLIEPPPFVKMEGEVTVTISPQELVLHVGKVKLEIERTLKSGHSKTNIVEFEV